MGACILSFRAGLWVLDPGLLLGHQALHELGPFLLVGLHALAQRQFANLRSVWSGSLAAVAANNPIETFAESGCYAQKDFKCRSDSSALDF
jgi:hypothetical protein